MEIEKQGVDVTEIRTSGETDELFAAMVTAQAMVQKAKADSYNEYHRSWYADMASAVEATRPALAEAGLAVMQFPGTRSATVQRSYREDTQNPNGQKVSRPVYFSDNTPMMETVPIVFVCVRTRVIHTSGQWIESTLEIPVSMGNRPAQAVGSTIQYARRYAWLSVLGVASGEDDDGNTADGLDYKAGRDGAPPKTADYSGTKPAASAAPRGGVNQPARPQGTEGRVQFHIDRFQQATNISMLRSFYESCVAELEGKTTDEQTGRIKRARDERRESLKVDQGTANPEAETQVAPEIEEISQDDEMINPQGADIKQADIKF